MKTPLTTGHENKKEEWGSIKPHLNHSVGAPSNLILSQENPYASD